jgi:hypothetical protein
MSCLSGNVRHVRPSSSNGSGDTGAGHCRHGAEPLNDLAFARNPKEKSEMGQAKRRRQMIGPIGRSGGRSTKREEHSGALCRAAG